MISEMLRPSFPFMLQINGFKLIITQIIAYIRLKSLVECIILSILLNLKFVSSQNDRLSLWLSIPFTQLARKGRHTSTSNKPNHIIDKYFRNHHMPGSLLYNKKGSVKPESTSCYSLE